MGLCHEVSFLFRKIGGQTVEYAQYNASVQCAVYPSVFRFFIRLRLFISWFHLGVVDDVEDGGISLWEGRKLACQLQH